MDAILNVALMIQLAKIYLYASETKIMEQLCQEF
jgi:hypothetical protein